MLIEQSDRIVFAFFLRGRGLLHFRMAFALSWGPSIVQRLNLNDMLIGDKLEPQAYSYLDDVIIVTETFEKYMEMLEKVLTRMNDAGLMINREKGELCQSEMTYLGVIVNKGGLRPNPKKIESAIFQDQKLSRS